MTKHNIAHHDIGSLAEDARALMTATADMAGEKVESARQRLTACLERSQEIVGDVRDKAAAGVKATDKAVQAHPYKAIAIAAGIGAIVGFFLVSRRSNK